MVTEELTDFNITHDIIMFNVYVNLNLYNDGYFFSGKELPIPIIQDPPVLLSKMWEMNKKYHASISLESELMHFNNTEGYFLKLECCSVAQSCLTLHTMDCNKYSLSFTISQVSDAILSSVIPFSSCLQSFPASGSFQWVGSSNQVSKVLEFQLQHQSFQWIFRTDFF